MSQLRLRVMASGLASYIGPVAAWLAGRQGKAMSARYCYSVWLKHLVTAREKGIEVNFESVAELGPGSSIGIGLAALLSGANTYYAVDVVAHLDAARNLMMLDELVELFSIRAPIADKQQISEAKSPLASYDFPNDILSEAALERSLQSERVAGIRQALINGHSEDGSIRVVYAAPWGDDPAIVPKGSVTFALSQAVMEHVDEPAKTYLMLHQWLCPDGVMSHVIDCKSHGITRDWDGHWTVSDRLWRIARGKRAYFINRWTRSMHVDAVRAAGFDVVTDLPAPGNSTINRLSLSARFKDVPDDDLTSGGAFIQAIRV